MDRLSRAEGSWPEPAIATPVMIAMIAMTTMISMIVSPRSKGRRARVHRARARLASSSSAGPTTSSLPRLIRLRHHDVVLRPLLLVGAVARAGDLVVVAVHLVELAPRVLRVEPRVEILLLAEDVDRRAVLTRVNRLPLHRRLADRVARGLGGSQVGALLGLHDADRDRRRQHA